MIDIIEFLYRQHKQLRQKAEMMWNENIVDKYDLLLYTKVNEIVTRH